MREPVEIPRIRNGLGGIGATPYAPILNTAPEGVFLHMMDAEGGRFVTVEQHGFTEYADFESMIPALFTMKEPDQAIVFEALIGDLGDVVHLGSNMTVEELQRLQEASITQQLHEIDEIGDAFLDDG